MSLILLEGPTLQGEEAYRYRLKAPTFTGLEDVERFIQEFKEVIDITQWPAFRGYVAPRRHLYKNMRPR